MFDEDRQAGGTGGETAHDGSFFHRDIMEGRDDEVVPIGLIGEDGVEKKLKKEVFEESDSSDDDF